MLRFTRFLKEEYKNTGIPLEIIQIATYLTHQDVLFTGGDISELLLSECSGTTILEVLPMKIVYESLYLTFLPRRVVASARTCSQW